MWPPWRQLKTLYTFWKTINKSYSRFVKIGTSRVSQRHFGGERDSRRQIWNLWNIFTQIQNIQDSFFGYED